MNINSGMAGIYFHSISEETTSKSRTLHHISFRGKKRFFHLRAAWHFQSENLEGKLDPRFQRQLECWRVEFRTGGAKNAGAGL